ncbi:hypothetical protein O9X98_14180 [Agrobacterium salinitolerans]|nr:hypothetical protein [Agrobacterium salinitolerans]
MTFDPAPFHDFVTHERIGRTLAANVAGERYEEVIDILNAVREKLVVETANADSQGRIGAWRHALDVIGQVSDQVDASHSAVYKALVYVGLNLDTAPFMRRPEEFNADLNAIDRNSEFAVKRKELYEGIANHPFAVSLREGLGYLSREEALREVKAAWDRHDKSGFLYLVDVLSALQSHWQRADGQVGEDTFIDDMASYPGLEVVVVSVPRGTPADSTRRMAPLPPLRIVISNRDIPSGQAMPDTEAGWNARGADEAGFWLISAKGIYPSLRSYLADGLNERKESIGHGPYYFVSNDDRCIATAANVVAAAHQFLAVPSNFKVNAQARLRQQVQGVGTAAVGPVYAHRYLRGQTKPAWVDALILSESLNGKARAEESFDAARELVTHGMVQAFDNLLLFTSKDSRESVQHGYAAGMRTILNDMREMFAAEDHESGALERFERYHGFHPDVMMFPVEERNRLAFQDLSDIAVGNLTGMGMARDFIEEEGGPMADVSVMDFVKTMVDAGDLANPMRLREHFSLLGQKDLANDITAHIRNEGYFISEEMSARRLSDLRFQVLISSEGDMYLKSRTMVRFKSVNQIVEGEELVDAVLASEALAGITYPPQLVGRREEQSAKLDDFIAKRALVSKFKNELAKVPDEERPAYIDGLRWKAADIAADLDANGVADPHDAAEAVISEVAGEKKRPLYKRVMTALTGVSTLMRPRI